MKTQGVLVAGILTLTIVLLVAVLLTLASIGRSQRDMEPSYSPEIVLACERFKTQPGNRVTEARLLRPYLNAGMSEDQIEALLGPGRPTPSNGGAVYYPAARSLGLTVFYDENRKLLHVEGIDDEYNSGIERAWPLIRSGMTQTEVTTRLGGPQVQLNDHTTWQYKPSNDPAVYTITFDEEGKVKSLNPTREEFQRRMEERRQQRPKTPN